jgi:uncharacterized membrane protein HdeD (DUF308 family)
MTARRSHHSVAVLPLDEKEASMTTVAHQGTTDLPRWMYIVRGVLSIAFGVLTLTWPGLSLVALVIMYGAYALVEGVVATVLGVARRGEDDRWWAIVLAGVVSVLAGILALAWPAITSLALLYIIGAWALVHGVLEIIEAFRDGWYLAVFGALSIVFGLFVLFRPLTGALALLWAIGWWAIFAGVVLIVHAFTRRRSAPADVVR